MVNLIFLISKDGGNFHIYHKKTILFFHLLKKIPPSCYISSQKSSTYMPYLLTYDISSITYVVF